MSEANYIYIIYKTTNLVNNKIYVGKHRQEFHFPVLFDGYLGSGVYLKSAIKKYGSENFIRETLFVFNTAKDTYNLCGGGCGGATWNGKKHSPETIKKMSDIKKVKNNREKQKRKSATQL